MAESVIIHCNVCPASNLFDAQPERWICSNCGAEHAWLKVPDDQGNQSDNSPTGENGSEPAEPTVPPAARLRSVPGVAVPTESKSTT